jgi:hypothetical protein
MKERQVMKKSLIVTLMVIVIVVVIASTFAATQMYKVPPVESTVTPTAQPTPSSTMTPVASKKPFYVGVTYCGNSATDAQQLIDTVKNYTNLFVVQSGPLMSNLPIMEQICDYAVNSGLDIIVYYARNGAADNTCFQFLAEAQTRWGSHFLGLYYNDEQAGKLVEKGLMLYDNVTECTISRNYDGSIDQNFFNITSGRSASNMFYPWGEIDQNQNTNAGYNSTTYFLNGTISFRNYNFQVPVGSRNDATFWYQPDGSVQDENGTAVVDAGDISQFTPYQQLWESRPLQTPDDTARIFASTVQNILSNVENRTTAKIFTSDYMLYWFDYQGGYDTVLAQLGWNNNPTQEIALVRGAANLQGKSWGTMITWKSLSAPYLMSADEMYSDLCQSYRSGAEYTVVFNYNPSTPDYLEGQPTNATTSGSSALLKDEHFAVLQKFWTNVVQNVSETNNITVTNSFVLPKGYGWGMRYSEDSIWGIWNADNTTKTMWTNLQAALTKYGAELDIVYNDPVYPLQDRYNVTIDAASWR